MPEENGHQFSKSFVSKGRILRNRCAQLKVQERYLVKQPFLFLQGKSVVEPPRGRTFIVPSFETFCEFQPTLNLLPLSSSVDETLLIFQTVIRSALGKGDQKFQQKCKSLLFDTPSASRVVFLNEITESTCSDQQEKELKHLYEIRLVIQACQHLLRNIDCDIIILACDEEDPLYVVGQASGLRVETVESYLKNEEKLSRASSAVISNLILTADSTLSHYRRNAVAESASSSGAHSLSGLKVANAIYSQHLSAVDVAAGISNGSLLSGKIHVFPHNYLEAEVVVAGGQTVLISGRIDMNRSLDGDLVIIRLHPKEKWNRILGSLTLSSQIDASNTAEDPQDDDSTEELKIEKSGGMEHSNRGVMATGMVVSIVRRDISEIVVTVPMNSSGESAAATNERRATSTASDLQEKESFILVSPLDMRLPKIRLRTRHWSKLEGNRIIVAFDNWHTDSMFPNGHLVRVIGEANDWKTEVESILIRHSIFPRPFSAAAIACLPVVPQPSATTPSDTKNEWKDSGWVMPTAQLTDLDALVGSCHRRDYRHSRRVFSVDPPRCQDIDDAMSVHWVEGTEGVIEVAVSIADVSAFLPLECALDLEAQTRGTTVYLTHKRMDMLPSLISGDIASLHGGKDRYAVTVTWHIKISHTDGRPVNRKEDPLVLSDAKDVVFGVPVLHSAGRTAISSVAAMTYAQAHNLIQGRAPDPTPSKVPPGQAGRPVAKHLWEDLRKDLKVLTVFGRFLKTQRERNGALDLTQTGGELKFKLNVEGAPLEVKCKEEMEVHNTIAELMIIANSTVARIIDSFKPSETLVRVHSPPPAEQQKEILKLVLQTGQGIFDGSAPEELRNHLRTFRQKMLFPKTKAVGKEDSKTAESIVDFVTSSVIKSMCEALYVCAGSLTGNIFSSKESNAAAGESRLSGHYGLGLAYYTHFTSPIRRYADIVVHRQLLAILESLGGGCGLKEIQLPATDCNADAYPNPNPNICLDYSDRSVTHTNTKKSQGDFILPGGSFKNPEGMGHVLVVPESSVSSLAALTAPKKIAYIPHTVYISQTTAVTDEDFPVIAPQEKEEEDTAAEEDDFLSDLLGEVQASVDPLRDGSATYQWDDSLLDTLLAGGDDDVIKQLALESCMDSSLDFLLDGPDGCVGYESPLGMSENHGNEIDSSGDVKCLKSGILSSRSAAVPMKNVGDSPYTGDQVARITAHLNIMNRRSKAVQMECQKMFLRLYFRSRVEEHDAIVYSLRDNGFLAYVPVFDYKGPVYLQNRAGVVFMDPLLLGSVTPHTVQGGVSTGSAVDGNQYDTRGRELPGYECRLSGGQESGSDEAQELLIAPKGKGVGTGQGVGPVLRIVPMQRVRVAITSSPSEGSKTSAMRLVLVNSSTNTSKEREGNEQQKKDDLVNRFAEIVIQGEEKVRDAALSSKGAAPTEVKSRKEKREETLYKAFKDAVDCRIRSVKRVKANASLKQFSQISARRYDFVGGRVSFGAPDEVRPVFILTRGKAEEMEKMREKRRVDDSQRLVGDEPHTKGNNKYLNSLQSEAMKDLEEKLLLESLKDKKVAAMMKMETQGEEWPEEEDLPSTWEAGEGGGADTEMGIKAANGGFSKEAHLASARQGKLKVAKKNSKYG